MTAHRKTLEYAQQLDQKDPLSYLREKFHIPKDKQGNEWLYFTGNSLGLQPKLTKKYIEQELDDWAALGVEGHLEAGNPWLSYHEFLTDNMAKIVGAKSIEVVVMNTLTTNLHLLMVSFYQPTETKYKIVIESDAFPSDKYAVQSQLSFHGFDPKEALVEWKPRVGEALLRVEDLETILKTQQRCAVLRNESTAATKQLQLHRYKKNTKPTDQQLQELPPTLCKPHFLKPAQSLSPDLGLLIVRLQPELRRIH